MNRFIQKALTTVLLSFGFILSSFSQVQNDFIYLKYGEKIECNIIDVTADKVKYKPLDKEGTIPYEVRTFTVALLVKSNGEYYVPGDPDTEWVQGGNSKVDVIYTNENSAIGADEIEISDLEIKYKEVNSEETKSVDKSTISGIIYKDGKHQIFSGSREFAMVLQNTLMQVIKLSEVDVKNTLDLDGIDYELYSRKALKKTEDLGLYIGLITNKSTDMLDKKDAIDLAVKLFIDENSKVEVSSVNKISEKRYYVIRKYLDRIRLLQYDKVEVKWRNISYVSKLRKGVDGKYYGIITVQQVFRGFKDGQIVYQDITQKDIEVILTTYEKQVDGVTESKWDVFLSDIGVKETKEG